MILVALGDTHRLLRNLRQNGYVTTRVRDSSGRLAWDIFYPRVLHDFNNNVNNVTFEYTGKVERYGGIQLGNYSTFGRPFFYATPHPQQSTWQMTTDAVNTARNTPRTTVRQQF